MKGVEIWDVEQNFWRCNEHFKIPKVFNKLYIEDKSKDKKDSSQIMWALALYIDYGSKFKNLSEDERKKLIEHDYIKTKFKWSDYSEHIKTWEIFKTPMQKQLDEWSRLMNEKTEYMRSLKFNKENADHIEELLISNEKLHTAYEKLKAKLAGEDSGKARGGSEESLGERGEI